MAVQAVVHMHQRFWYEAVKHTIIVDENAPVNVQQGAVVAGQAEPPEPSPGNPDVPSELQVAQQVRSFQLAPATCYTAGQYAWSSST